MKQQDDVPLYSSRITNTYVEYLQKFYPDIKIDTILEYSGMTRYEVEDPGHWFTQTQVDRFHEHAVKESGNPDIARAARKVYYILRKNWPDKTILFGFNDPLSTYI